MSTSRHPCSDGAENRHSTSRQEEEYVFRFPVGRQSNPHPLSPRDVLGVHLRELLDLLTLSCKGEEVKIDGYAFLNNPDAVQRLYPPDGPPKREVNDPLEVYEPRIGYISRIIESLSEVVEFEYQGRAVAIDGVRLKRPDRWVEPGGGTADLLAHTATRCNLQCRFCYNEGSPPVFRPRTRPPDEEFREVLARIGRYVPGSKLGIFPHTGGPCESLYHPRILDVLAAMRGKTDEPIRIPTNGSLLTPEMIRTLAGYRPIFFDVSLNSASHSRRRWLMNDPKPETAIDSLGGLRDAGIPYSVVIVPWPFPSTEIMLEDLKNTVCFAADRDPAFIQVSLPGYSRFFSEDTLYDREQVWRAAKEATIKLRNEVKCPLILRPGLYEEYLNPEMVNSPCMIGAIRNSPSDKAGLRMGDRLMNLGGFSVKSRPQARYLLAMLGGSDTTRFSVIVQRNRERLELKLDTGDFDYPYDLHTDRHLGVVFASSGIPQEWIENLHHTIFRYRAREVLVLTSKLVRPVLEKMFQGQAMIPGYRLHLQVPINRYMGGNIFMGDLLTVEDFTAAVRDYLEAGGVPPDLVLIPSSPFHLSGWGRDLTGRVYKEVERELGIPVALIDCDPVFD